MSLDQRYPFTPDYAVHPGVTLNEVLEHLSMSKRELSIRTGLSVQSIIRIIRGDQTISVETASKLDYATGVPSQFWNSLEVVYQEQVKQISEREQLVKDIGWLSMIPVRELINRGFIPYLKDKVEQLKAVLAFYGVSSVENWHQLWSKPPVAARRSECFDTLPGPASAWIRQGEIISNDIQCNSYNAKVFEKNLKTIKSLTVFPAEEFIEKMKVLCAEAGVALALVPEMKKVPWYGATKWINPDKAMILLNLRGKSEDKFWFSFFHEACHVLKHDKRDLLINNNDESDPREIEANEFAANFLIPIEYNDVIIKYTKVAELRKLAIEQGVSVGIVAGRYRFLTQKWDKFSSLISRFEWVTKTKDN